MYGIHRSQPARPRKYRVFKPTLDSIGNEEASTTPVMDWRTLSKGTRVEIREDLQAIDRGWIDDVTADGLVAWVIRDQGAGRVLVERTKKTTAHLLEERPPRAKAAFLTAQARP